MSLPANELPPRIEGIPTIDGTYWYYKRASVYPSLVLVGTRDGERVIKDGPAIQRYWCAGEFFVGPIEPPFATPENLANCELGINDEPLYPVSASGMAISGGA